MDSSGIYCGRIYSVFNGLIMVQLQITYICSVCLGVIHTKIKTEKKQKQKKKKKKKKKQ